MTRRIIKLDPQAISYLPGGHGYYKAFPDDRFYRSCDVFSDETFIRLWFKCRTIEQFVESYASNHKNGYSPEAQSCHLRAKKLARRLKVKLPVLRSEKMNAHERSIYKREQLRDLVHELTLQQRTEEVGIIPPVYH